MSDYQVPVVRFRLRTLLIVLAIAPPFLWFGRTKYEVWRAEQDREQARQEQIRRAETDRMTRQRAIEKMLAAQAALVEARMEAHRAAIAERQNKSAAEPNP